MLYGGSPYASTPYGTTGVAPRNFTQLLTDGVIVASSLVRSTTKILSDTTNVAVIALLRAMNRTLTSIVNASESLFDVAQVTVKEFVETLYVRTTALIKDITKILTSTVNVSSVITTVATLFKTLSDSVTVAVISLVRNPQKVLSDAVNASSSLVRAVTKVISSTLSVASTLVKELQIFRTFTDSLITSSTLTKILTYGRTLTDGIVVATTKIERRLNGVLMLWTKLRKTATDAWTALTKISTSWTSDAKESTDAWTKQEKPDL